MPCLEPNRNLSEQAKAILKLLAKIGSANKQEIAEKTGFDAPLVSRKLRELIGKGAVIEKDNVFAITDEGKDAVNKI